jgi:hypothetical protein
MPLDDGREVLLRCTTPLPAPVLTALITAVSTAARRLGYTDITMTIDGEYTGQVAAASPARPALVATGKRVTR